MILGEKCVDQFSQLGSNFLLFFSGRPEIFLLFTDPIEDFSVTTW